MKEDYQKAFKKVISFFLPNPAPFNRQNYQKQKGSGTSDHGFWLILNIKSANLCKTIYDIINYSTSICPFASGKCGKDGRKIKE